MNTTTKLLGVFALLAAPTAAPAQGISDGCVTHFDPAVLIEEGDPTAGSLVTTIGNLAINASGTWVVEVDTDDPNTDADGALVKDGLLLLSEGAALVLPAGSTLDFFDTVNVNAGGDSGWNFFLDGTTGFFDDSGVFFNTSLLIQEGDLSGAPQLSPGTPYIGFFETKINASNDMLVMASVDDALIATSVDRALVRLDLDGAGNLLAESVVAKEGDLLPGQVDRVADFETGPHNFALNDAGQALFIADLVGNTAVDHALYRDGTLLAQEGSPSPVTGRSWSILASAEVDLSDAGGWVLSGSLDGDPATNLLIAVNGAKLVQEGDPAPGGHAFTSFGSGPVHIGDNGNALWYGDWDDPDTSVDTGLFLNDLLIVQEGVSQVGGATIDTLRGIQDGYALSPDGQWVVFEAVLVGGTEGAYALDIGPWVSLGQGLAGTAGLQPCMLGRGSLADGSPVDLILAQALPGASAALVIGLTNVSAPFKGGVLVPKPDLILFGGVVNGAGEWALNLVVPAGLPPGLDLFFQYWVSDPLGPVGFSASNAVVGTTP